MTRKTIKNRNKNARRGTRRSGGTIIKLKCEYNTNNANNNGVNRRSLANFVGPLPSNQAAYKKAKVNAWLKNEAKKKKKENAIRKLTEVQKARMAADISKRESEKAAAVAAARAAASAAARFETNNGNLHPWTHNSKKYYRTFSGEVWTVGHNGAVGEWVGLYNKATNKINTTAPEPEYNNE